MNEIIKATDVADFFLCLTDEESGDNLSNLKLQKLIYYAQGFHLALFHKPLFDDKIEAWEHGPVVKELYHKYKTYGSGAIPKPKEYNGNIFSDEQIELMKEIFVVYGQYSAWRLREITHSEQPWQNTPRNQEITQNLMTSYFQTQINSK